jgi:flagellar hook assembly protein FlgD
MRVKAWDVANNSSEEYSEFVVAENEIVALRNIFNYPNPFTTSTCFQFDHNQAGKTISVEIKIYSLSGRLVKTLNKEMISDGAIRLDNCIPWDGLDEYGDKLGKGIYLYRVGVETEGLGDNLLKGESDFKKLVIIK